MIIKNHIRNWTLLGIEILTYSILLYLYLDAKYVNKVNGINS